MQYPLSVAACLAALLMQGIWERLARGRALRAVPIRIHVNGTRGKSTVTRLIAGALKEAGIPAVAKTTGTAARILLPDGSERPVNRHAPPSIREQLWLLGQARRAGARAVVAECMAIRPELQWMSERAMLSSTIGVVTNVRLDHTDAMGASLDQIAESLANTTPESGTLVVGDRRFLSVFERRAAGLGTTVIAAEETAEAGGAETQWEERNRAVALAVTRVLGISDPVALEGMRKARPDPGAARASTVSSMGREVRVVDAAAANDPESLDLIMAGHFASDPSGVGDRDRFQRELSNWVAVFNHREDRPLRLRVFAEASLVIQRAGRLILTGDRPPHTLLKRVREVRGCRPVTVARRGRLASALGQILRTSSESVGVVFCGNTKGLDIHTLVGEPDRPTTHG